MFYNATFRHKVATSNPDLETAVGLLRDRRPTPAWNKHVEHFLAAHPVKPSGT